MQIKDTLQLQHLSWFTSITSTTLIAVFCCDSFTWNLYTVIRQLFWETLSHRSVKVYATKPKTIVGVVWHCLIGVHGVFMLSLSIVPEHCDLRRSNGKHSTFRHCYTCIYASVGQPFLKQLYEKKMSVQYSWHLIWCMYC